MEHEVKRWTHPSAYMGATHEKAFSAGFGESRESSALERSNFRTAWKALEALDSDCPVCEGSGRGSAHEAGKPNAERQIPITSDGSCASCHGTGRTVNRIEERHWAVGWVAWISIHESNAAALDAARAMCERANDYPPLDEDDWSTLEFEEACDWWARESLSWRVELCAEHGESIFAARRDSPPDRVLDYLRENV